MDFHDLLTVLDALPDPAWIFEKATRRFLAVNAAAVQRYGWSREEFLALGLEDIRPQAERDAFLAQLGSYPSARVSLGEWHHRSKDGSEFLVDVTARDLTFRGRACRIVVAQEAFERRMAWMALRETQETYSGLVENLAEGVAILDEEGRFLWVNGACGRIFGLEPDALMGRRSLDFVAEGSREAHRAQLQRPRGGPSEPPSEPVDLEIHRADGERRWLSARTAPRTDSSGGFAGTVASFFDITSHRLALEAQRQSEARFRRLVEMLPQGLVTYQDGKILYSNPAASAITRTDPAATVGKPILDFVHPFHWPAIQARMARMLAGEPVPPMDYTFVRADGTEVQVEAHVQMLEGGERPVMVSVFTDLTRRLEMERAIRDSEARFRLISEETGQLTYDFDTASGLVRWAGPMQALLGLPDGLVIDVMEWGARLHPDDYDRELAKLQRGLETLEPIFTEYRIRKADGTYLPVEDHGAFLAKPDGKSIRMIGTLRDISARYAAEQALKESEALYRSVVEQAQDMIYLVDLASLKVLQANRAFQRVLGYGDEAMAGLDLYGLVDADRASIDRNVALIRAAGSSAIGRRRYLRADGGRVEVEVSASLVDRSGQGYLVVLARDITERLATERALQQSQRLESLGVLAGGIAHDFNNLLTAMMGNLSLAQLKSHPASPAWGYLDALEKSLQRAADLTRQMLAYSGKGKFLSRVLDLNQLVSELTHLLSVSITKRAALRFDFADGLPPVEADPAQLQQVVMNLVTNASDALGDSDGTIRIATGLVELGPEALARDFPAQALAPGQHVLLEVSDTGCGMDEETLGRIFEPFFTTKATGRGLGLSAMLGILRGHRAGIRIETAPGRGTTFRIYFPAKAGAHPEEGPATPQGTAAVEGCVLVVDDEDEIRRSAADLFQILGCDEVLQASDGLEALRLFRARPGEIRLVFMDLTMPRMGGLEAFRALRAEAPGLPVILTSGYTDQARLEGEDRPDAFLAKPYRFQQLRAVVMEVLHRRP